MSASPKRRPSKKSILAQKKDTQVPGNGTTCEAAQRHARIAEAAYLRAEQRHFEPGHDVEDWLAAESALNLAQHTAPRS